MGLYCGGGAGSCTGCPTNWNGTGSPPDANVHASVSGKVTNCGNETGTVTISCTGSRVFIVTSSRYQRSCGGSDYSATGWMKETGPPSYGTDKSRTLPRHSQNPIHRHQMPP